MLLTSCVLSRLRAELSQTLRLQDPEQLQRREEAPLVKRLPDGGAAQLGPPALGGALPPPLHRGRVAGE